MLVAKAEREIARTELAAMRRARRWLELAMRDGWKAPRALAALGRALRMEWFLCLGQDPTLMPQAQRAAQALFNLAPGSALAHRELGATAQFMGDYDVSFAHLSLAREIAPFDIRAEYDYACALISDGQARAGVDMLKAGAARHPDVDGFYHWASAIGHFLLGEYRSAISDISAMPEPRAAERMRAANLVMLGEKVQTADHATAFFAAYPSFSHEDWLSKSPVRRDHDKQHLGEAMRQSLATP